METWREILDSVPAPVEAPTRGGPPAEVLEPKPKAVLFDVYGTLVRPAVGDLEEQAARRTGPESFRDTARRFGFDPGRGDRWRDVFFEKIRSVHREVRGLGVARPEVLVERIWQEILVGEGIRVTLEEARAFAMAAELSANPVLPFEGAAAALDRLKEVGVHLGLASNSQFYTLPILGKALRRDPGQLFDASLSVLSYRLGFAKPDPYFFLVLRTRLQSRGLEAHDAVVVGNDGKNDVLAARSLGFRAVLFCGDASCIRNAEGIRELRIPLVYTYPDLVRVLLGET